MNMLQAVCVLEAVKCLGRACKKLPSVPESCKFVSSVSF